MKLYLIGFMGCGKSTVGRHIAYAFDCNYYDTDKLIEEKTEMRIPNIFKHCGELMFRKMECETLYNLADDTDFVVSTGGGLPCYGENMDYMLATGTVIYLQVSQQELFNRLKNSHTERPLLKEKTDEELQLWIAKLIEQREGYYNRAHHIVSGEGSLAEVCQRIVEVLLHQNKE